VGGGASFNRIGGTTPADRNVISQGSVSFGPGAGNLLIGNFIGTDISGSIILAKRGAFVSMAGGCNRPFVGGTTAGERNVISGMTFGGIQVGPAADYTFIGGNYIGTDASGQVALGNGGAGVVISQGTRNVVQGNLIAHHSPGAGITVSGYAGNTLRQNLIYDNQGGGIVLSDGSNNGAASPVITSFSTTGVSGTACPDCEVEIFSDSDGEGQIFEGSTFADASGAFRFDKGSSLIGPNLTATATDISGSTSAFSAAASIFGKTQLNLGALNPGGATKAMTIGSLGAAQVGYADITINSGTTPYATAVFRYTQNNVVVSETAVPASPPTRKARIFIDYRFGALSVPGRTDSGFIDINTGFALVNYGSNTATVTYTLRNASGDPIATGHGTVVSATHHALFIDQLKNIAPDFNLPADFSTAAQFATLEISADQPLSVVALRQVTNQRHEALFTTTPVADLTQPSSIEPVYFAQFVDGGGYIMTLILMNTSPFIETGTFQILDDNGTPIPVNQVGGFSAASFSYRILPGGFLRFQTDGRPAAPHTGWVRLTPDSGTSTPVGAAVFSYNPASVLITESGVPAAGPTTHARLYVDLSGNHNTGLAIANVLGTSSMISTQAFQSDGTTVVGLSNGPLPLAGGGHTAKFADELIAGLPPGFTGVLDISSTTPFAALTLRALYNERHDFILTTFPIADLGRPAPSPIVFPQIADGGGFVTEFILLGAGGASSTTIKFYSQIGAPLPVGK
jgi:parallel beta-helix repeat protein